MQMAILGYGTDHKNPKNAVTVQRWISSKPLSLLKRVFYKTTHEDNEFNWSYTSMINLDPHIQVYWKLHF